MKYHVKLLFIINNISTHLQQKSNRGGDYAPRLNDQKNLSDALNYKMALTRSISLRM